MPKSLTIPTAWLLSAQTCLLAHRKSGKRKPIILQFTTNSEWHQDSCRSQVNILQKSLKISKQRCRQLSLPNNLVEIPLIKFYHICENRIILRPNCNHSHRDIPKPFLPREGCHLEKFWTVSSAVLVLQLSFKRPQPSLFIMKALFCFLYLYILLDSSRYTHEVTLHRKYAVDDFTAVKVWKMLINEIGSIVILLNKLYARAQSLMIKIFVELICFIFNLSTNLSALVIYCSKITRFSDKNVYRFGRRETMYYLILSSERSNKNSF